MMKYLVLLLILTITWANAKPNDTNSIDKRLLSDGLYVYKDANYAGDSMYYAQSTSTNIIPGSTFYNSISSLQVRDNSVAVLYTAPSFTGPCWAFAPGYYSNLASYGINDQTKSIIVAGNFFYSGGNDPLVVLYKDSYYVGRSISVTATNIFVPIDSLSTAIDGCGNFPLYSLSSVRVFPHTNVTLACYVNNVLTYTIYANSGTSVLSYNAPFGSCPNDSVNSLKVLSI